MDPYQEQIFNSFIPGIRSAMNTEILNSLDAHHKTKTHKLRKSIDTIVTLTDLGDRVIVTITISAGGSEKKAYYGWFLEYGTGRYMDLPDRALQGYPGFSFNPLRPAAGNGWDIVGRPESEFPGRFISKGIKPSHWFKKGLVNAFRKFEQINSEIAVLLKEYQKMATQIPKLT